MVQPLQVDAVQVRVTECTLACASVAQHSRTLSRRITTRKAFFIFCPLRKQSVASHSAKIKSVSRLFPHTFPPLLPKMVRDLDQQRNQSAQRRARSEEYTSELQSH